MSIDSTGRIETKSDTYPKYKYTLTGSFVALDNFIVFFPF